MTRSNAARSLVREAEGQRRHPRYRIPGKCEIGGRTHDLIDWSVGGAAIANFNDAAEVGERLTLSFVVPLDAFHIYFETTGEVRAIDRLTGRLGVRFVGLSPRQAHLLRTIVDAHPSSEAVPLDNVIRPPFGRYGETVEDIGPAPLAPPASSRIRVLGFLLLAGLVATATFVVTQSAYGSASVIPALRADGAIGVACPDGVTVAGGMAKFAPKLLDAAPAIDGQSPVEIELGTGRPDVGAAWDGRAVSVRIDTSPAPSVGKRFGFGI